MTSIQSDGKIIIGGDFTSYNGTGRNRIARLNGDCGVISGTTVVTNVACFGGTTGAIVYQSAAGATAFLAASATNGYVLKYDTTTKAPYWAADVDTDTHYTSKNIIGATAGATANATAANAALYLNHIENGSVTSTHKITGAGATSVASDASGNLTITSANT